MTVSDSAVSSPVSIDDVVDAAQRVEKVKSFSSCCTDVVTAKNASKADGDRSCWRETQYAACFGWDEGLRKDYGSQSPTLNRGTAPALVFSRLESQSRPPDPCTGRRRGLIRGRSHDSLWIGVCSLPLAELDESTCASFGSGPAIRPRSDFADPLCQHEAKQV